MTMIEAGEVLTLDVDRETESGYILTDGTDSVLLHFEEMEEGTELMPGDSVKVFVYLDKQGDLAASMYIPEQSFDTYGWADVAGTERKLGAFVDIGLPKDLLVSLDDLPNLGHLWPVKGDRLYVRLTRDKEGRLFGKPATEDVMQDIAVPAPAKGMYNQPVKGHVYRLLQIGSFMISEEGYRCFIHESERSREPRLGQYVEGRVIDWKEDGSLNVSLYPFKQEKMEGDALAVYTYLMDRGGAMPYGDKTSPDDIRFHFGLSKAAFKRALGKLMKDGKIYQEDGWTYSSDRK